MAYQSDLHLSELAAFAAVAEHGGFSAAARATGARKATLSERVTSLERRLGVALMTRSTRALRLTDEGIAYAAHASRALAAAREADSAALASRARPTGTLRVTMSPPLTSVLLDAVFAPYMRAYPEVVVELDASVRVVDLAREGFDLAIRVGRLPDSSLTLRRLGTATGGYYASRAYVARNGKVSRPEDLAQHATIGMQRGDRLPAWHFASGTKKRTVVVRPRVVVGSFELGLAAAVAGLGIVPCSRLAAQPYVARRQLVPVLEAWTPPPFDVNALFVASAGTVPKTRLLLDALDAWFASRGRRI